MAANTRAPNRIKEFRRAKGLTAFQLAQKIGVRESTVYRWEMGFRPLLALRLACAQALDVALSDLFPPQEDDAA